MICGIIITIIVGNYLIIMGIRIGGEHTPLNLRPKRPSKFYKDMERYDKDRVAGLFKKQAPPGIAREFQAAATERLMPTPDDPTVHYEDPTWNVDMRAFHDTESPLSQVPQRMKGKTFNSLTEMTEHVYRDRVAKRGLPAISSPDLEVQKHFNTHSATNQSDFIGCPRIKDKELSRRLGFGKKPADQEVLATQHIVLKNGFNGAQIKRSDGTTTTLKTAVAGSWDRESETLQMGRRIARLIDGNADPEARTYCYTGRPDTLEKAIEQAEMITFSEFAAAEEENAQGLFQEVDDDGDPLEIDGKPVYRQVYVIHSIESTSPLYGLGEHFEVEQEQEYFEREKAAIAALKKDTLSPADRAILEKHKEDLTPEQQAAIDKLVAKGLRRMVHPKTGEEFWVRPNPILLARQVNALDNISRTLDGWTSGATQALEVTREGWEDLKAIAMTRKKDLSTQEKKLLDYLIDKLEKSYNGRSLGSQDAAVEEIFCMNMLNILLELPPVDHCKSSTDRTSIAIAMIVSLSQWLERGNYIPDQFETLMDNEYFKELFAMNWIQGQQLTRNARSPEGMIEQDGVKVELDHEALGISINSSIAQCSLLARLLPKRYLKPYGWTGFLKNPVNWFKWLGLMIVGTITTFFGTLWNPNGTLPVYKGDNAGIKNFCLGVIRFLPRLIWNYLILYFGFARSIPAYVVDVDALGVGPRRLVKEAKAYQKTHAKALTAIPANAKVFTDKARDLGRWQWSRWLTAKAKIGCHRFIQLVWYPFHKLWHIFDKIKVRPPTVNQDYIRRLNTYAKYGKTVEKNYDHLFRTRFCSPYRPKLRHFIKGAAIEGLAEDYRNNRTALNGKKLSKEVSLDLILKQAAKARRAKTNHPIKKDALIQQMNDDAEDYYRWKINEHVFKKAEDLYAYLREKKKYDRELTIEIMRAIHQQTNPVKRENLFHQMNRDIGSGKLRWKIDNVKFKDAEAVYRYLRDEKNVSQEKALELMCVMQQGALTYPERHLHDTLDVPEANIMVSTRHDPDARIRFHLDTTAWRITIDHDSVLRSTATGDIHATIHSKTVLNCNQDSDEYGQGFVDYNLKDTIGDDGRAFRYRSFDTNTPAPFAPGIDAGKPILKAMEKDLEETVTATNSRKVKYYLQAHGDLKKVYKAGRKAFLTMTGDSPAKKRLMHNLHAATVEAQMLQPEKHVKLENAWMRFKDDLYGTKDSANRPSSSKDQKTYDNLFRKRFCQAGKPMFHVLKGSVIEHATKRVRNKSKTLDQKHVFAKMLADKKTIGWKIDGKFVDSRKEIYNRLRKKLPHEKVLEIMSLMNRNTIHYGQSPLKEILDAPTLNIAISTNHLTQMSFNFDTKTMTLTFSHNNVLKDISSGEFGADIATEEAKVHATICSTTVLNCDPQSDKYGQGIVQYALVSTRTILEKDYYRPFAHQNKVRSLSLVKKKPFHIPTGKVSEKKLSNAITTALKMDTPTAINEYIENGGSLEQIYRVAIAAFKADELTGGNFQGLILHNVHAAVEKAAELDPEHTNEIHQAYEDFKIDIRNA